MTDWHDAVAAALERWRKLLIRIMLRNGVAPDELDDAWGELAYCALRGCRQQPTPSWLGQVAACVARKHWHHRTAACRGGIDPEPPVPIDEVAEWLADHAPGTERAVLARLEWEHLDAAIEARLLPDTAATVRAVAHGCSGQEVADLQGVSRRHVWQQMTWAREVLS